MNERGICRICVAVLCVLTGAVLAPRTQAADIDHINVPSPQELPTPWSTQKDGYNIHIYARPDSTATDADRSVLILGMWSGPKAVQQAAFLINPATHKPYDVVIGLGSDSKLDEVNRVVAHDHINAAANATALAEAIQEHFGQPLVAHTLDLHSNGNTVGITALLQSQSAGPDGPIAFQGVKAVNSMGPDIGYGGQYLDADHIKALQSIGVESVDVFRIKGDIVPELGELSKNLVSNVLDQNVATAFATAALRAHDGVLADAAAQDSAQAEGAIIHYHDLPSPGPWLWWSKDGGIDYVHFISHYVDARSGEPASASPPPPDVQAEAENEQASIEKALADNNLDELAKCLHRLGARLSLADRHADRDRIESLMRQLEQVRVQLDQRRLDVEIQTMRAQEQDYLTAHRDDVDAIRAFDEVIAARNQQKEDALRQQQIFAEWASHDSRPQAYAVDSSSPGPSLSFWDVLTWLDGLLPAGPGDDPNRQYPNSHPNRPNPPPQPHPHVPMPAPEPFNGM